MNAPLNDAETAREVLRLIRPHTRQYPRVAGRVLKVLGPTTFLFAIWQHEALHLGSLGFGIVGFICYTMIMEGSKLTQPTTTELMEGDDRTPVLFLRPFKSDGALKDSYGIRDPVHDSLLGFVILAIHFALGLRRNELEADLVRALRAFGPAFAVGRPQDFEPDEGASRGYLKDNDWQDTVRKLIRGSQIVVWQSGCSDGVLWELRQIVNICDPRNVLLLIPNPAQVAPLFAAHRTAMNTVLPRPLEMTFSTANFIGFDADWTPRLFGIHTCPWPILYFVPPMFSLRRTIARVRQRQ
jgi:hypothetical protein